MPDQDERNPQSVTFFIVAMAIVLCLLFFGVIAVFPQTNMGPIRTPQINTTLYVGQTGYPTIQSAVTFACRTGSQSYAVTILPGVTTGGSPTSVTGGCSGTYIADLHQLPHRYYAWSGTAYILSSTLPGFSYTPTGVLNLAAGSELANSPLCTEATGCPTQPTSYPPAGIGVSTGTGWNPNSIDPATVATWPLAGVPVSTGTAWSPSIDPTTIPRTNTTNTFTQSQMIEGDLDVVGAFAFGEPIWFYPGWNFDLNTLTGGGIYQGTFSNAPPEGNWTTSANWIIFNSPIGEQSNFNFQMAFPVFNWAHVPVFFLRQSIGGTWTDWWQFNGIDTGVLSATTTTPPRNLTPEQQRLQDEHLKRLPEIRAQSRPLAPPRSPAVAIQPPAVIQPSTPRSSKDSCTAGAMWNDARYIYVCIAANRIKRVALGDF